jgi:tRNA (guanine-N7-)-methyltransferase
LNDDALHRPVRSFVLRQGRMSPAQHRAYDELLPRWGLGYATTPPDLDAVFGRHAPRVLEIGCGMGETTPRDPTPISSGSRCTRRAWAAC